MGFTTVLLFIDDGHTPLYLFILLLFIYHVLEFTSSVYPRPYYSSLHDFMLFHSPHFMLALTIALVEYFVELHFVPSLKSHTLLSVVFTGVTLVFQGFRSTAMYYAGTNFNHYIESKKREGHVLVTTGIYKYLRHPSYFGWFWWSITTQCVLLNPVSIVLYSLAAWYFFYLRIPAEEETLVDMFGDEYEQYRKRTVVGIPFIH